MFNKIFFTLFLTFPLTGISQSYLDSITSYRKNYIDNHQVVKSDDRKGLQFFDMDKSFRAVAKLERKENMPWVPFTTSANMKKNYRVYGVLHFSIGGTALQLNLYQSQDLLFTAEYKDYLFLPFTDLTTGKDSYEVGRYIDLRFDDIINDLVVIDFNKAYNPYCSYVSGLYNCPIPPKENHLAISIQAGEKKFVSGNK